MDHISSHYAEAHTAPSVFDKHELPFRVIIIKPSLSRFNLPIGTETTIWARRWARGKPEVHVTVKARRRGGTGGRSKKACRPVRLYAGGRREVRKRRHRSEPKLTRDGARKWGDWRAEVGGGVGDITLET
jgi:hypothetical protein